MSTTKQRPGGKGAYRPPTASEFQKIYGAGTDKLYEEVAKGEEKGQILVHFSLDASPSMAHEFPHLLEAINEIAIPAMKGVSTDYKHAMRIACNLFSSQVVPAWLGYRSPWQIGPAHLSADMLKKAGYDYTSLYEAAIEACKSAEQAVRCYTATGPGKWTPSNVTVRLLVFTDGADCQSPNKPADQRLTTSEVKRHFAKHRNPNLFQTVLVYFETGGGIPESRIDDLAKNQMGFQEVWYFGSNFSIEERRREFRHRLGLFSSKPPQIKV